MQEVSDVFDVPIAQIKQWIREERLAFAEDSVVGLECEGCGVTIKTGRFCKECKEKMARGLKELYPTEEEKQPQRPVVGRLNETKENPRMRYLNQNTVKKTEPQSKKLP